MGSALSLSPTIGEVSAVAAASPSPVVEPRLLQALQEAEQRFGVPREWLAAIIAAESAGDARAVSSAGAMGLMQVMPATWRELRQAHGLGADPFDVRDNILAGAAYLRQLHDRYGAPGFLAAYNAGPGRYEAFRDEARPLPAETRRYVASLSARLGFSSTILASTQPPADWRRAALFPVTPTLDPGVPHSLFPTGPAVQDVPTR
ncbi:MAG: lytic transglycosylase domain-containing protein [Caulobacter sp.]|nr:lytic transglycosylase domain-containing protein [Caulobacter sp.]